MKLLLTDCATLKANNDLSLDIFKQFGKVIEYENIERDTLLNEIRDIDILLCNKTVIDKEVMENAVKLKYRCQKSNNYTAYVMGTAHNKKTPSRNCFR